MRSWQGRRTVSKESNFRSVKVWKYTKKLCDYGVQSRFVSEKAYAFTFRGIDFVSMEALLQGLKSEGVEEQNEAFRLVGV